MDWDSFSFSWTQLINFILQLNSPTVSILYQSTEIKIVNNKNSTDPYKKDTDKVQYLLPTSCNPSHVC